jgi:hypothetical protein
MTLGKVAIGGGEKAFFVGITLFTVVFIGWLVHDFIVWYRNPIWRSHKLKIEYPILRISHKSNDASDMSEDDILLLTLEERSTIDKVYDYANLIDKHKNKEIERQRAHYQKLRKKVNRDIDLNRINNIVKQRIKKVIKLCNKGAIYISVEDDKNVYEVRHKFTIREILRIIGKHYDIKEFQY